LVGSFESDSDGSGVAVALYEWNLPERIPRNFISACIPFRLAFHFGSHEYELEAV
jgi:hypothetical protein